MQSKRKNAKDTSIAEPDEYFQFAHKPYETNQRKNHPQTSLVSFADRYTSPNMTHKQRFGSFMTELKPIQPVNLLEKLNDLISSPLSSTDKSRLIVKPINAFSPVNEDSASIQVETENELASTKLSNIMVIGTNRMIDQTSCLCNSS